jgi:hypothetical protein
MSPFTITAGKDGLIQRYQPSDPALALRLSRSLLGQGHVLTITDGAGTALDLLDLEALGESLPRARIVHKPD